MQTTLAETLRVIAENAPRLRAAGVQQLAIDGVSMVLAPPAPSAPADPPASTDEEPTGDLDDPTTYGRPEGSSAPGFVRPDDLPRKA
jgi:hypothetical protein